MEDENQVENVAEPQDLPGQSDKIANAELDSSNVQHDSDTASVEKSAIWDESVMSASSPREVIEKLIAGIYHAKTGKRKSAQTLKTELDGIFSKEVTRTDYDVNDEALRINITNKDLTTDIFHRMFDAVFFKDHCFYKNIPIPYIPDDVDENTTVVLHSDDDASDGGESMDAEFADAHAARKVASMKENKPQVEADPEVVALREKFEVLVKEERSLGGPRALKLPGGEEKHAEKKSELDACRIALKEKRKEVLSRIVSAITPRKRGASKIWVRYMDHSEGRISSRNGDTAPIDFCFLTTQSLGHLYRLVFRAPKARHAALLSYDEGWDQFPGKLDLGVFLSNGKTKTSNSNILQKLKLILNQKQYDRFVGSAKDVSNVYLISTGAKRTGISASADGDVENNGVDDDSAESSNKREIGPYSGKFLTFKEFRDLYFAMLYSIVERYVNSVLADWSAVAEVDDGKQQNSYFEIKTPIEIIPYCESKNTSNYEFVVDVNGSEQVVDSVDSWTPVKRIRIPVVKFCDIIQDGTLTNTLQDLFLTYFQTDSNGMYAIGHGSIAAKFIESKYKIFVKADGRQCSFVKFMTKMVYGDSSSQLPPMFYSSSSRSIGWLFHEPGDRSEFYRPFHDDISVIENGMPKSYNICFADPEEGEDNILLYKPFSDDMLGIEAYQFAGSISIKAPISLSIVYSDSHVDKGSEDISKVKYTELWDGRDIHGSVADGSLAMISVQLDKNRR